MLNKSHFDWNDMRELQEIGLIALVCPEAVERLFAAVPDARPEAGHPGAEGGQTGPTDRNRPGAIQRSVPASRGTV